MLVAVPAEQPRGGGADGMPRLTRLPDPPRKETAAVEFPAATWTSFDRYARYGAIVRAIRANLGAGLHRVVDVGDNSGWLLAFDADLVPISIDIAVNAERLEHTRAVVATGAQLPLRDRCADAAVSSDALEHVPESERQAFLCELSRVSDLVVLAAPFDTPGVAAAENFVQEYVRAITGATQDQLEEHAANGLPSLDGTVAVFREAGFDVAVTGNGNLSDWLVGMVAKHQLAVDRSLDQLGSSFDVLYNGLLAPRNDEPPYYRHVVVARRGATARGARREPDASLAAVDTAEVLTAIVAGTTGGAVSRPVIALLEQLQVQQQTAAEHLMARFSGAETALADLQARVGALEQATAETRSMVSSIHAIVRHPVRTVSRRARRAKEDR